MLEEEKNKDNEFLQPKYLKPTKSLCSFFSSLFTHTHTHKPAQLKSDINGLIFFKLYKFFLFLEEGEYKTKMYQISAKVLCLGEVKSLTTFKIVQGFGVVIGTDLVYGKLCLWKNDP